MNTWICPVCDTTENTGYLCRICGFDERKNYSRHPSVFRLTDVQKKQYPYISYSIDTCMKNADSSLENQDCSTARMWYQIAARQGNAGAQRMLGDYYSSVGDSEEKAVYWYKKAADSGDPQAQYELAVYYSSSEDTDILKQCFNLYESSANAGYAKAQHIMGELHSEKKAALWYQKAAGQGYAKSIFELANLYKDSHSEEETVSLYLRAAELGYGSAQHEIWHHYLWKEEHPGFHSVLKQTEETRWYQTAFGHHEWIMKENFFHFLLQTPVSGHKQKCLEKLNASSEPSWLKEDPKILAKLRHLISTFQYDELFRFLSSEHSILAQTLREYYTCKGLGTGQTDYDPGLAASSFMMFANGLFGDCINYAEIIEKYAVWGCHDLQFDLGFCYANGFGVPVDAEKAAYWYKKAESCNPAAVWRELGILYETNKDDKQAIFFYQKAADADDSEACFRLGRYFERHIVYKNHTEMLRYFEKAAMLGHAQAQSCLGICYDAGIGTEHDAKKAVYWYEQAAKQWDATGLTRLGICFEKGRGVEKNAAKAVQCYQKAASQMDGYACYLLAKCYETGSGTKPDKQRAEEFLSRSAKLGNNMKAIELVMQYPVAHLLETLCTVMEHFYGYLTDESIITTIADSFFNEENPKRAATWYQRLLSAGYSTPSTWFQLGECFFRMGKDDSKYYSDAFNWYQKAAASNAAAQRQLGIMYKHGYGISADKKEAKKWLKSAAKLGDKEAKKQLWF